MRKRKRSTTQRQKGESSFRICIGGRHAESVQNLRRWVCIRPYTHGLSGIEKKRRAPKRWETSQNT